MIRLMMERISRVNLLKFVWRDKDLYFLCKKMFSGVYRCVIGLFDRIDRISQHSASQLEEFHGCEIPHVKHQARRRLGDLSKPKGAV